MAFPSERQWQMLARLVNQALGLDPLSRQRLQHLAGKRLRVECTEPALDVLIAVEADGIRLSAPDDEPVTTHLRGDLSAFAGLLSAEDKAAALINADVRLKGDSQPLIDLQHILAHLELDWEYHLAKIIGDMPAHLLGRVSRESIGWLRKTQPVFLRHLQEFIQHEAQLAPTPLEMDYFVNEVMALQERSERLQAKLQRLQQQLNQE